MKIDLKELGRRIKIVRENLLGLSQSELAELLGKKQVSISNLETGKGASIGLIVSLLNLLHSKGLDGALIFKNGAVFDKEELKAIPTKFLIKETLEISRQSINETVLQTIESLGQLR